jgi:hypothetical protein
VRIFSHGRRAGSRETSRVAASMPYRKIVSSIKVREAHGNSHLVWVYLVEFGVVEQQTAPLRQAGNVAIAVLPADVVS